MGVAARPHWLTKPIFYLWKTPILRNLESRINSSPSTAVSYKITRDEELVNEKLMQEAQLKSEVDTFPLLKSSAGEKCVNLISMGYYMIPVFESQHIKKSHFLKRILRLPVQTVANEKAENALPKFEQIIDF